MAFHFNLENIIIFKKALLTEIFVIQFDQARKTPKYTYKYKFLHAHSIFRVKYAFKMQKIEVSIVLKCNNGFI